MPHDERRPRSTTVAAALVVVASLAAGATIASARSGQEGGSDLVARGRDLYGARCATCHGAEGRGITGVAPSIQEASPALTDFVIRTGRMPLPHADAPVIRREPQLTDEQRRAVVAYVRTFAADEPDIPSPRPEEGRLDHGREVYESNCIACHSASGRGAAISQRDVAPPLFDASPVEIAEAIRVGPGVMPVFGPSALSEDDVDAVIRYLQFLKDRPTPGGLTIGRSGPVTEGFVAWLLGTVGLLVAAYFIGEHRDDGDIGEHRDDGDIGEHRDDGDIGEHRGGEPEQPDQAPPEPPQPDDPEGGARA